MKTLPITVTALALVLLAGCGKSSTQETNKAAALPAVQVRMATAKLEERPSLNEVVGTVRPVQRALIAAKVMGTIEELPVVLGQRVSRGDLLLKISAAEIAARALQAQSQLNQARRELERERELLTKGASTADLVKSLEDRFAMTQALVREAEVMLGYTSVKAPFDGVVSRRIANAGDLASPGTPLLELEGRSDFQIEAGIPDSLASSLRLGGEYQVEVPASALSFQAKLVELSSAADPAARSVPAKFSVPSGLSVRSGQFARLNIPGASIRQLQVPESSVVRQGQIEALFVVGTDSRATLRIVRTGALRNGQREILAGLADGDRVVSNPPVGLVEGRLLEVQP